MDLDSYANYQNNGTSHLLAISGMHISLFSALIIFILKKLGLGEMKTFLITFVFLCFYAFLTGFPASIVRALAFMLFLNLNKLFGLKMTNIQCLIVTICIILLINPFYLYDLGFQYSVITVFSIILSTEYIQGNYFLKTFKISLVAFIFSMPLTLYNFYEINLLSPIINVLFVPLISYIVYPLILLCFFFKFLSPIAVFILRYLDILNTVLAKIDFATIIIPKIPILLAFVIYLLLFIFILTKRKIFLLLVGCLLLWCKIEPKFDKSFYLYFLDVGQGDSAIMISPHQSEIVMIDTGGVATFDNADWKKKNRVYKKTANTISFLKSLGIKKINYLILTHGDYDHMGEANNLVEKFKVEKVIFNCGELNDLEIEIMKVLDKKKIPYYYCIKELNIDNNKLYFLNNKDYGNENDNSSVIYTELKNYKFLFMGDAGAEVEQDLLEKYNLQNIDILKVGHHGSRTSSSELFINEIEPKYSVISVGKNNRYGHPNDSVLDNLERSNIYRTDQGGSVMFMIRNNKLTIETCEP